LVLDALSAQQLIAVHGSGRAQLYEPNRSHSLASALAKLFRSEQQLWEQLLVSIRELLAQHGPGVRAAWLYGSVARGEDTARSDVDVALLVKTQAVAEQVREEFTELGDHQHVQIAVTALTPSELAAVKDDSAWWSSVVRDGRVLKGAAPEIAKRQVGKICR
jgi:predicted nucleotidyltransferase